MKYGGIYRGYVASNADPANRQRLRVKVPQVLGKEELPWATPAVPTEKMTLPARDSGVWVMFEGGDINYPVWTGVWKPAVVVSSQELVDEHEAKPSPHSGHETPTGAQNKVDTHENKVAPHVGHALLNHAHDLAAHEHTVLREWVENDGNVYTLSTVPTDFGGYIDLQLAKNGSPYHNYRLRNGRISHGGYDLLGNRNLMVEFLDEGHSDSTDHDSRYVQIDKAWTLIQDKTLPAGVAANTIGNLDFANIPTHFTRLRIVAPWFNHTSTSSSHIYYRLNDDFGTNYGGKLYYASTAAWAGTYVSGQTQGYAVYSYFYGGAGRQSWMIMDIFNPIGQGITVISDHYNPLSANGYGYNDQCFTNWNNTVSVSKISLWTSLATNWSEGSRFLLYGMVD